MSGRRILLWVLVAIVVLVLIAAGVWLFARAGFFPFIGRVGITTRAFPGNGRFFGMPRGYGMMPGYARSIGFPLLGWLGSILIFALGVGVGLILAAIGRRPASQQPTGAGSSAEMPAAFEAWHNQLHEQEAKRPAAKRARRS
jgi:hypothetical protein